MQSIPVSPRREVHQLVLWDGHADTAEWVTEQFGEQATITGDGDELTLKMWGTWEIPVGDYIMNRWGGFHYIPAGQVDDQFEPAAGSAVPQ